MKISDLAFVKLMGSTAATLVCLGLAMILVLAGTLAQVDMGTFAAQRQYFGSVWIFATPGGISIPVFPGGLTIGFLWILSIICSLICRADFYIKRIGLLITHAGILILIAGQAYTQIFSEETNLAFEIGQTKDYSESRSRQEVVFTENMPDGSGKVLSVPVSVLSKKKSLEESRLPFTVSVQRYYLNSRISMIEEGGTGAASNGMGMRLQVHDIAESTSDDDPNSAALLLELKAEGKSLGTWLVSAELSAPQNFNVGSRSFSVDLRAKRNYMPFSLTLKKFSHDVYAGTGIPKNFSSLVQINNSQTGESREALIYMNHPLRYGGLAFYQASYGKGDTLSILQVVKNPGWLIPYLSCLLVSLGLILEFLRHFLSRNSE